MKHAMSNTVFNASVRAVSQLFWFMATLITIPILLVFSVYRHFVGLYLQTKYKCPIEFVKALDALSCFTNENITLNIENCHVFKRTCDIDKLRRRVDERWLQQREVDGKWKHMRLRQQLKHELGYFFWLPQTNFRIENHVKQHDGPPLKSKNDLHKLIAWQTTNLPVDKGICWQILLVRLSDTYLTEKPESQHMILFCATHALCDGISAFRMQSKLFDNGSEDLSVRRPRVRLSERITFWRKCLLYGLADTFAYTFNVEKNCLLGAPLTGNLFVSVSEPIDLSKVKEIKNFYKTTENDVLQSCVTGALRRYIVSEGLLIPSVMRFSIPVSFHSPNQEVKLENNVSGVCVETPVDEPTCVGRLMKTKAAMDEIKIAPDGYIRYFGIKMVCNRLPSMILRRFAKRNPVTALVSCVPSFMTKTLVNNKELQQHFIVAAVLGLTGSGLSIAISSRNEDTICTIKADSAIVKSQQRLDRMTEFVLKEIDELHQRIEY